MSLKLALLVLAVAVAAADCFSSDQLITRQNPEKSHGGLGIYDGKKTTIQKHPYLVAILVEKSFYCAGTIVSNSWVMTIGDCASGMTASSLTVVAASEDGLTGESYDVKDIVIHPKFVSGKYDYDYACIQINGKFKWSSKTKAVKLPKKQPKVNTNMVTAGWGATSDVDEDESNSALLEGNMKWQATKVCKAAYADFGFPWTSRLACTYNKGKTTLCNNDWADAFVYRGVFYGMFIGGGSAGFCSSDAIPVFVSNIQVVAPWIKKTTGAKYEDE